MWNGKVKRFRAAVVFSSSLLSIHMPWRTSARVLQLAQLPEDRACKAQAVSSPLQKHVSHEKHSTGTRFLKAVSSVLIHMVSWNLWTTRGITVWYRIGQQRQQRVCWRTNRSNVPTVLMSLVPSPRRLSHAVFSFNLCLRHTLNSPPPTPAPPNPGSYWRTNYFLSKVI